jgi:hypothetical protein
MRQKEFERGRDPTTSTIIFWAAPICNSLYNANYSQFTPKNARMEVLNNFQLKKPTNNLLLTLMT